MIAYYHEKLWQDGPPSQKKRKPLDVDLPKPLYRPGYWVCFHDRQVAPDIEKLVGKIKYVVSDAGVLRYEIQVGYTYHGVPEKAILERMVSVQ